MMFAVALASTLVACTGTAIAAGGYGPTEGGATTTPGGYTTVVTAHTFGAAGGALATTVGTAKIKVSLPKHAVTGGGVEVELTKPDLTTLAAALPSLGLGNKHVITGIGLSLLKKNGTKLSASQLLHPVTITFDAQALSGKVRVLEFSGPGKIHGLRITRLPGKPPRISVTVASGGDLFVVA